MMSIRVKIALTLNSQWEIHSTTKQLNKPSKVAILIHNPNYLSLFLRRIQIDL